MKLQIVYQPILEYMPKHNVEQLIDELALMVGRGFESMQHDAKEIRERVKETAEEIKCRFDDVTDRLDRLEYYISGQERRISILEDRVRVIATKLGLDRTV